MTIDSEILTALEEKPLTDEEMRALFPDTQARVVRTRIAHLVRNGKAHWEDESLVLGKRRRTAAAATASVDDGRAAGEGGADDDDTADEPEFNVAMWMDGGCTIVGAEIHGHGCTLSPEQAGQLYDALARWRALPAPVGATDGAAG